MELYEHNASNHRCFAEGIKWGKMSEASAPFKHRSKTSGGFELLGILLFMLTDIFFQGIYFFL